MKTKFYLMGNATANGVLDNHGYFMIITNCGKVHNLRGLCNEVDLLNEAVLFFSSIDSIKKVRIKITNQFPLQYSDEFDYVFKLFH